MGVRVGVTGFIFGVMKMFWKKNVLELDNETITLNCSCSKSEFYMGIVSH